MGAAHDGACWTRTLTKRIEHAMRVYSGAKGESV